MTTPARPSVTMCVIRQSGDRTEVLMVRRSAANRLMPGAWVFPGGAVDAADHDVAMPGDPGFDDLAEDPSDLSPAATGVALDED